MGAEAHTVDIGTRREGGVVGESAGDVIVGSIHIVIFLQRELVTEDGRVLGKGHTLVRTL